MVSALLLRSRFDHVTILESQSKERFLRRRGFTFPIVLSPAAGRVLREVGAWDAINAERSPYFGVVVHKRFLGRNLRWTARREGVYSHWRNHIISSLHNRVVEEGINVVFDARLESIDFESRVCRVGGGTEFAYDLLLGADGMHSHTRSLMAMDHPEHPPDSFATEVLDRWYAYRVPSVGGVDERYGNTSDGVALHVHVDNQPGAPDEKFRAITVAMTAPEREVSIVIKHGQGIDLDRLEELNTAFIGHLVDAKVLDVEWRAGVGGEYRHVMVPTFRRGAALLVGDAAHGFEGNGDLINLGIGSISALPGLLDESPDVPEAIRIYDESVGSSLRNYSSFAMRRSREKINFEVAMYEAGAFLGVNGHHPSFWGIYEDGFEIGPYMARYDRIRKRNRIVAGAIGVMSFLALARALKNLLR
jgi:2-polyprenyl-6-methoxyphenol hydroxylase-like FAD-dependent oxidoreductase